MNNKSLNSNQKNLAFEANEKTSEMKNMEEDLQTLLEYKAEMDAAH